MSVDGHAGEISPVPDRRCPACGAPELHIEYRLEARPIGTFSLAGAQTKVSATEWPWLVCGACGAEAKGKVGGR